MTNIKIFLINCTTLSRNLSVEPKNKEKKIIFPHRIRAFFSGKTIEFAGVFLNMIDCLRMQIKLSPYGSIGATRGEDKTKTLRMYFCQKCYPFNYSWKHLESDLEINFFCFLPFWNEKSLNAWFPMAYFNLTEKHFFVVVLAEVILFLCCRIQFTVITVIVIIAIATIITIIASWRDCFRSVITCR